MKLIQMLPTMAYGDAVGNHTLALDKLLRDNGYDTAIYARNIDKRLEKKGIRHVDTYKDDENTIILYHLSIGDELNSRIKSFKAKIIINYHNVTPGRFFTEYNYNAQKLCDNGLREVKALADTPSMCICDSEFNKSDLIEYGYKCPMEVIPILIPFEDYREEPNRKVIKKYSDDFTNIVFAGRVAPNKKQEDLIAAFYYYHTYINPKSRLIIVGSYDNTDEYYRKLKKYKKTLDLDDVIFTGHIPFDEILAYYKVADLFLCLSEHEGFCVPLVEAMEFKVPVIAYDSTAVGGTLGGSALLLNDKNPKVVAEAINKVIEDRELGNTIVNNEQVRLKDFDNKTVGEMFLRTLNDVTNLD